MEIVLKKTGEIIPYLSNPRENDKTVQKLVKIIPMVGFNVPLVIDKNNVIVKGHARFKAAKELGMEEVPCIVSEANDEQNKLDRISDNRVSEFSLWLGESLRSELSMLNLDIKDLELGEFTDQQENKFINRPIMVDMSDLAAAELAVRNIPQKIEYIKCKCDKCSYEWFIENNKGVFVDHPDEIVDGKEG